MSNRFRYFVIFAEMRTGSNFLESNLSMFDNLACLGEAFNPTFPGTPNADALLGVTLAERERNPHALLTRIIDMHGEGKLAGFRYFTGHEPRIYDDIVNDPTCAKIILTRNPIDSYVSWRIAQNTGQWKLTNVKRRKDGQMSFNMFEFERYLSELQGAQITLLNRLQMTGQTAFYISYDDINDLAVINGLGQFLGANQVLEELNDKLKPQNPASLASKVENYEDMVQALQGFDRFDLARTPNFEPRRGPAVSHFVTGIEASILFMPIPSAPYHSVRNWLAALDGGTNAQLPDQLTQPKLRDWLVQHPNHCKFSVLRHPVARAHTAFCDKILSVGEGSFSGIRRRLRNFYKLPLPGDPSRNYTLEDHKECFKAFLHFLKQNLRGQTSIRVDGHWASQAAILQGITQFALPDRIIREENLEEVLAEIGHDMGYHNDHITPLHTPEAGDPEIQFDLQDIYDAEIEDLTRRVYQLDYMMFGFENWA